MKKLLLILSCVVASAAISFAQSKEATEPAMNKFVKYYNAKQVESIRSMCGEKWGEARQTMWTQEILNDLHSKYGRIEQIKHLGTDEDGVEIYMSVFETGPRAIGLNVDAKGKLETFRFITSSPRIEKMISEAKL